MPAEIIISTFEQKKTSLYSGFACGLIFTKIVLKNGCLMEESKSFTFLNISSSPTDERTKAFIKNSALSQAARYCHSRRSRFVTSARENISPVSQRKPSQKKQERLLKRSSGTASKPEMRKSLSPGKPTKSQLRWRVKVQQPRVTLLATGPRYIGSNCSEPPCGQERLKHLVTATTSVSIPMHKGNSDPFGCAAIPMTALDYAVMDTSFLAWLGIIWPSEIHLRGNEASLAIGFRKYMPSVLDHAGTAHGILSEAFSRRAREYKARGLPCESALRQSLKHRVQAIRITRELVEKIRSGACDDKDLDDIRRTSAALGAAEIASSNFHVAQTHYAAAAAVMDIRGGCKTLSSVELDGFILPVVASAWFARVRPALDFTQWDPGAFSDLETRVPQSLRTAFKRRPPHPQSRISTMGPKMGLIMCQTRELLDAEELKFVLATSNSESATDLFRWSHRRKLAVRARNLHHWCDLKEATANLSPSLDSILCLAVRCFEHSIFEEYYLSNNLLLRPSRTLLAELTISVRVFTSPLCRDSDAKIVDDKRRFDMLWIYSVGAYIENHLLELGRLPRAVGHTESQEGESCAQFFGLRFRILARALKFRRFEDLTTLLSQEYLYCARLQEGILRKLVDT
ncbi:hypothetical protein H2200_013111 [Cladophialophora chaetospira]|uniref:Uncharacterized protein n=1 Tax=Cladophialophora chaetospira TaxID=386627 RepID=A0AA39CBF2_9EURO|nr:hypothetical protein H2200_013111 [Cladophialophora chaetospira]